MNQGDSSAAAQPAAPTAQAAPAAAPPQPEAAPAQPVAQVPPAAPEAPVGAAPAAPAAPSFAQEAAPAAPPSARRDEAFDFFEEDADRLAGDPLAADPLSADPLTADPLNADPLGADPLAAPAAPTSFDFDSGSDEAFSFGDDALSIDSDPAGNTLDIGGPGQFASTVAILPEEPPAAPDPFPSSEAMVEEPLTPPPAAAEAEAQQLAQVGAELVGSTPQDDLAPPQPATQLLMPDPAEEVVPQAQPAFASEALPHLATPVLERSAEPVAPVNAPATPFDAPAFEAPAAPPTAEPLQAAAAPQAAAPEAPWPAPPGSGP